LLLPWTRPKGVHGLVNGVDNLVRFPLSSALDIDVIVNIEGAVLYDLAGRFENVLAHELLLAAAPFILDRMFEFVKHQMQIVSDLKIYCRWEEDRIVPGDGPPMERIDSGRVADTAEVDFRIVPASNLYQAWRERLPPALGLIKEVMLVSLDDGPGSTVRHAFHVVVRALSDMLEALRPTCREVSEVRACLAEDLVCPFSGEVLYRIPRRRIAHRHEDRDTRQQSCCCGTSRHR
jgi:hypothetical protein